MPATPPGGETGRAGLLGSGTGCFKSIDHISSRSWVWMGTTQKQGADRPDGGDYFTREGGDRALSGRGAQEALTLLMYSRGVRLKAGRPSARLSPTPAVLQL